MSKELSAQLLEQALFALCQTVAEASPYPIDGERAQVVLSPAFELPDEEIEEILRTSPEHLYVKVYAAVEVSPSFEPVDDNPEDLPEPDIKSCHCCGKSEVDLIPTVISACAWRIDSEEIEIEIDRYDLLPLSGAHMIQVTAERTWPGIFDRLTEAAGGGPRAEFQVTEDED